MIIIIKAQNYKFHSRPERVKEDIQIEARRRLNKTYKFTKQLTFEMSSKYTYFFLNQHITRNDIIEVSYRIGD